MVNPFEATPLPWVMDEQGWLSDANDRPIMAYGECGSHSAEYLTPHVQTIVAHSGELYEALEDLLLAVSAACEDIPPAEIPAFLTGNVKKATELVEKIRAAGLYEVEPSSAPQPYVIPLREFQAQKEVLDRTNLDPLR